MSDLRLVHVEAPDLGPFVPGLRALEAAIPYPAGSEQFTIDHGPDYHPFFSGIGQSHFALAWSGDAVLGNVVGVRKQVACGVRLLEALYICDLKVAPTQRGRGLARRLLAYGLWRLLVSPKLRRARLLFGAAMRGQRGDVTRSARGATPLKLARPWARCDLYLVPPAALASLQPGSCPPPPPDDQGLDLSPQPTHQLPGLASTAGRKDLRLAPDGRPWPLVHLPLGPRAWRPSWGHYLRACGQALVDSGAPGPACFGLDQRLVDHRDWLASAGLTPTALFTVHGLDLTRSVRRARWIHLASSEI
jgi:GNAT superfamily N-acetyltransferase